MKLSDIKGDRALDVIADLIEPISNIAQDEVAMELFSKKAVPEGMEAKEFFISRVKESAPQLLKGHKSDIIVIMSAIEGVTPEEYTSSLTMAKVISDVVDLVTDEELLAFLS